MNQCESALQWLVLNNILSLYLSLLNDSILLCNVSYFSSSPKLSSVIEISTQSTPNFSGTCLTHFSQRQLTDLYPKRNNIGIDIFNGQTLCPTMNTQRVAHDCPRTALTDSICHGFVCHSDCQKVVLNNWNFCPKISLKSLSQLLCSKAYQR